MEIYIRKLRKIYIFFKYDAQVEKLKEELYEFLEAILLYLKEPTREHIIKLVDELNDITILVHQIALCKHDVEIQAIQSMACRKLNRTESIIEEMKLTGKTYDEIRKK